MKKLTGRLTILLLVLALMLALCSCSTSNQAAETTPTPEEKADFEVTDILGRTVSIPGETGSYACIGPGCLRLYCYVADTAKLVGVEDLEISNVSAGRPYALAIENLSEMKVIGPGGPGNAPDAELLFAADPDVIFTMYNSDASTVDELQDKTGIPVVALSYGDAEVFDEAIYESLTLIGKITGNEERAGEVVQYIKDIQTDLNNRTKDIADRPSVYLGCQSNRGNHGIESTVGNYVLFDALNIRNAAQEAGIPEYASIEKEQILEMDPDIIIIDAGGYSILTDDYSSNPEFYNSLAAVKNSKMYMQMPYNWYSTNLEIAMADAYYIGSVVYPDAFSDVDIEARFNEISDFMLGIQCYKEVADTYYGGYQQVELG